MDFRQTIQPNVNRQTPPTVPAPEMGKDSRDDKKSSDGSQILSNGKLMRIVNSVMLIGIAVLLAGIVLGISRGTSDYGEGNYVLKDKYQAVFLTNGQVYFGNITSLNSKYISLSTVYYLTQSGNGAAGTSSNYSLIKLGCQQIHDPYDQMVINRDQVSFWENMNNDGKVVTSINDFKKQNPKGPDCSQVSSQTQAGDTTTQNATSPTTGTNTPAADTTGTPAKK